MLKSARTLIAAAIVALSITSVSMQSSAAQGLLESCEPDIEKFCSEVTPGNGHIISCMYAYEDQISDQCSQAIIDFGDVLDHLFHTARTALALCANDIQNVCAGTEIGGGRILTCLHENSSEVTAECNDAVAGFSQALAQE